jgi:hypothetical protein
MRTPAAVGLVVLACCAGPPPADAWLRQHAGGWGYRESADGQRLAWFTANGADPWDFDAHELQLRTARRAGGDPDVVTVHAKASGADLGTAGPIWLPDGGTVVVGYSTTDDAHRDVACVDRIDVATGTARVILRDEGGWVQSLAVAADGVHLAVMTSSTRLVLVDTDGAIARRIELPQEYSYRAAAAFSPDQRTVAAVTGKGLFFVPVGGGEPRRCCPVPQESVAMATPQWLADGSAVVVAAGGGVVHASPTAGELHTWSPADLGGRADSVALLPDGGVAAIVTFERDGGPLQLLLGAGHAPKTSYAKLMALPLTGGAAAEVPGSEQQIVERARNRLPYLPHITEVSARYCR